MSNIETAQIIPFAAIRPKLAKGERRRLPGCTRQ
jgi:hypothetical protein